MTLRALSVPRLPRAAALAALGLGLLLSTTPWGTAKAGPAPSSRARTRTAAKVVDPGAVVDLNTATADELVSLPRVGPALAQRILDYRKSVGTIRSVDELLNVKGIGEKSLELLRPHVTVSADAKASRPSGNGPTTPSSGGGK